MEYGFAGFNGQPRDPISGHYPLGNGYRAYSPVLRRFTSPDNMSPFDDGGISPYVYCAGDPVNRIDPSGHLSLGQGIGMALGMVAGIALGALSDGLALAPMLSLLANMAGDAIVGAGTTLTAAGLDGEHVSWALVGKAVGEGALTGLVFKGIGSIGSKFKRISQRPFGGLMMEGESVDAGTFTPSSTHTQINLHPENASPLRFYKSTGIEVKYNQGKITHTRLTGFTSDFNGKGEPGLILHRSVKDKLKFTLGSATTIKGVQMTQDAYTYTVGGAIDYFFERGIDLINIMRDKPIHLVVCSVGKREGLAQMLANMLGRDVIAYGRNKKIYHGGLFPLGNGKVLHNASDTLSNAHIYRPLL